jgi:hypothetical protein
MYTFGRPLFDYTPKLHCGGRRVFRVRMRVRVWYFNNENNNLCI